ncbi:MAG: ribosome-associated translation inhibitor RaiA [Deltaproteobacteria bacterium]|nr:ribosome-associated translation inhibitor RaiA [Deltaproteobacteria bacterium]
MQITTTFRHMESSDALKDIVQDKVSKLKTYIQGHFEAAVVLSAERHLHECDMTISTQWGQTYKGKEKHEDVYAAITKVMDKIERQAEKDKGRMRAHRSAHVDSVE